MDTIDRCDVEGLSADENDCNLGADHDAVDADEEVVALDTGEYVEFVVQTSVVEFVEDLHPDKRIEHHCGQFQFLLRVGGVVAEDSLASKVEDECDCQLEDGLANDHFPHIGGN